ncbi:MAG: 50S ribosomal protein L29 [Bdellovibrionales bacterium]|nr:50S ribosomal protein L29 [Bdellovibrionales bacterium]
MKKSDTLAELKAMSDEDLRSKARELGNELMRLRFRKASGQLEQVNLLGQAKRTLAQAKTILTERANAA